MDELVDPYWVAPSIELENLDSHVTKNTYVHVDDLNNIFGTSGCKVYEDDETG
jgi:hypothetical protein